MNRDLLMRKFSYFFLVIAGTTLANGQGSEGSLIIDDNGVLDSTTVSGAREVIETQEAVQQSIIPSIATKTTPTENLINWSLPSVDNVSAADIRTYQRRDLSGVLQQSAGVSVIPTGGAGSQTSLFVRGMESNHTVVLLNGRRLPPGLAGIYQLEHLDVSTLESVQFLRGGASSLYGSDAMAGAIDLRSADARFVDSNTLSSYVEAGSFSTIRTGHKVTLSEGPVGVTLDGSYFDTMNDRPNSDYTNGVIRGNVAVEITDGVYFDLLGYIQDSDTLAPGSSLGAMFPQNQLNSNQSSLISPRLTIERDDWDFSLFYSHTENELKAIRAPFFGDNLLNQVGDEAEAQFNYRGIDNATLTVGGGSYDYSFDRMPIIPGPFNPAAAFGYRYNSIFGLADIDLPANFHLLVSGRYDDHDTFESKGTYSAELGHYIDQTGTLVFGKVATGYKAPSGQDFIFLDPSVDPASLSPEDSQTWEIGFRQDLCDGRASFSATYFQSDVNNLVDSTFSFATFTSFPAIVDTDTSGFEFELRGEVCENVDIYANYTNLDAKVVDGTYFGSYVPGDRLIRRPRHTFNAGIVAEGDGWTAGAEVSSASDRPDNIDFITNEMTFVDDYIVARLFGSCEINDNVEFYGRLENVFDEEFEHTAGFKASGFGVFAGLRVVLGE